MSFWIFKLHRSLGQLWNLILMDEVFNIRVVLVIMVGLIVFVSFFRFFRSEIKICLRKENMMQNNQSWQFNGLMLARYRRSFYDCIVNRSGKKLIGLYQNILTTCIYVKGTTFPQQPVASFQIVDHMHIKRNIPNILAYSFCKLKQSPRNNFELGKLHNLKHTFKLFKFLSRIPTAV